VTADGTRLRRALYGVTLKCDERKIPDVLDTPRRNVSVGADGFFEDNVKSSFPEGNTTVKSDERFEGTLGSIGAEGTLSITERRYSRKTKKLLETCKTGKIRWTAAP
jgi:hypothetical protein